MEVVLHVDDVRFGHTTNTSRVPAQKVHNYRSDRWIALNFFSRVSVGCFKCCSLKSVLHANDTVWSGHTIDMTRVPAQKVHYCRSEGWIDLKFFSRVSGGCFTWSSNESVRHANDVRLGHTTNTTRVPAQKVYKSITIDPIVGSL